MRLLFVLGRWGSREGLADVMNEFWKRQEKKILYEKKRLMHLIPWHKPAGWLWSLHHIECPAPFWVNLESEREISGVPEHSKFVAWGSGSFSHTISGFKVSLSINKPFFLPLHTTNTTLHEPSRVFITPEDFSTAHHHIPFVRSTHNPTWPPPLVSTLLAGLPTRLWLTLEP